MRKDRDIQDMPRLIVVMGVCGTGKTQIARALSVQLDAEFVEGDDLHPPASVDKMRAGQPLTDQDRWPWLDRIGAAMIAAKGPCFCACSALRRVYREALVRAAGEPIFYIHLTGPRDMIAQRMAAREGHYMPVSLLDSQLATLEPPAADEQSATISIEGTPEDVLLRCLEVMKIDRRSSLGNLGTR